MNFTHLPQHIKKAVYDLTKDEEFNKRLNDDDILDSYDEMKDDKVSEFHGLMCIWNKPFKVEEYEVKQLTPAKWSYLWAVDSPFVCGLDNFTQVDIDLFLYILENGIMNCNAVENFENAVGYCEKHELDKNIALAIIQKVIGLAFYPLKMFPSGQPTGEKSKFDGDWITSMVAKVHYVTGETPDHIMHDMSLCSCCYYFAQWRRLKGDDTIYKRSSEELVSMIDRRWCEIICEYLISKGIMKQEENEECLNLMLTPENINSI